MYQGHIIIKNNAHYNSFHICQVSVKGKFLPEDDKKEWKVIQTAKPPKRTRPLPANLWDVRTIHLVIITQSSLCFRESHLLRDENCNYSYNKSVIYVHSEMRITACLMNVAHVWLSRRVWFLSLSLCARDGGTFAISSHVDHTEARTNRAHGAPE